MIRSMRGWAVGFAAAVPTLVTLTLAPAGPAAAAPQATAFCGQVPANRVGTTLPDTFTAAPGDVFATLAGTDTVYTDSAATTVLACLGDGSDYLGPVDRTVRPAGTFTVFGGSGSDAVFGGTGDDDLQGEFGGDTLVGGPGRDSLDGGSDADHLLGEEGDDFLNGSYDNDVLFGGAGNDYLWGGKGADAMYGGAGIDRCFQDNLDDTFFDCEVIER